MEYLQTHCVCKCVVLL